MKPTTSSRLLRLYRLTYRFPRIGEHHVSTRIAERLQEVKRESIAHATR